MTNAVFLDTVGVLATWDRSDQWQEAATTAFADLRVGRIEVVTTTFVLAECANASARRPYRLAPELLRERLTNSGRLIVPTDEDWQMAWLAYRRGEAGGAGVVDHMSFAVMRRMDIRRAFTNDAHFRAAGLETMF